MTPKEYDALVRQLSPSSPIGKDTALAFVVGGGICAVGQLIANGWQALGLTQQEAASATSVTLVFLSVLLTALGLYHRLARYAGAGTLVPITGLRQRRSLAGHRLPGRGHRHRHGGQDVHRGRAGDRIRYRCQRGVRAGAVSAGVGRLPAYCLLGGKAKK